MTQSAHIGFLTTSFPRRNGDTAGSFVFGMARALARRGHTVEVIAPEPVEEPDWRDNPGWLEGVRVIQAPYARPRHLQSLFYGGGVPDNVADRPGRAILTLPAIASLAAWVRVRTPSWRAVVSHWLLPSAILAGMARHGKTRHLAIAHSGDVHLMKKLPCPGVAASAVARCSDHLGFVSKSLRQEFLGLLDSDARETAASRSSVTPMGIDSKELVSSKSRTAARDELRVEGFTVLFLGRLVPIKGVDLLIDAARGLDDVTLIVAGDGPERERLESRARATGARVRFLGAVGARVRADLLAASDVLVLSSRIMRGGRHEGLPLVLLEALAAGLPVVATRTGAVCEIIENSNIGLLVEPDDPGSLTDALKDLKRGMVASRRWQGARRASVEGRDWRKLVPVYEDLLLA